MLLKYLKLYGMKVATLFAALSLTVICTYGQNLIGYNYREIRKYMKENHMDMNFNSNANSKYNYLKYTDNSDSQTVFFFLNPDSVCKSIRMICNASLKAEKEKEFNSRYKKVGDYRWLDKQNDKDYLIEIRDEEWYSVITIEPDK
jgi:hypothetical protein